MKVLRNIVILVLLVVMAVSAIEILKIDQNNRAEYESYQEILKYKPELPAEDPSAPSVSSNGPVVNQGVIDLQGENADVVGWLTVPGTNIDHPFVQAPDNDFYLRRGLDKEYLYSGTLFCDYRCEPNLSGFNTIIYGHHMKNTNMFHDLGKFEDAGFFNTTQRAFIFLPHENLTVQIFSYLVVPSNDTKIYSTDFSDQQEIDEYAAYVRKKSRQYRDADLTPSSRIITLSTCGYEFESARIVVLGVIAD